MRVGKCPDNEVQKPRLYITFFPVICNLSSVFTYRSPKVQVYWPHESTNSSAQVWPSLVTACSELHWVLKAPPLPQESWPHPVAHLWKMSRSPVSWANRGSRFGSLISAWDGFHLWEASKKRRAGESLSAGCLNKTISQSANEAIILAISQSTSLKIKTADIFAAPLLVSPWNDVWGTAGILHWRRVTAHIWVVLLIGWSYVSANKTVSKASVDCITIFSIKVKD